MIITVAVQYNKYKHYPYMNQQYKSRVGQANSAFILIFFYMPTFMKDFVPCFITINIIMFFSYFNITSLPVFSQNNMWLN